MNIPNITTSLLTNSAYGYPSRGNGRRIKPLLLACIHITGNSNNLGENAATNERNYANRADSPGPSAHYYINRDGSAIRAIEPTKYAAWSNGDVQSPKTNFMGYNILKGVYLDEGYNANEAFLLEFENVGYSTSYPITQAQKETMAYIMASGSLSQNIPIDRSTVFGHSDINSVNRPNDPIVKSQLEAFLSEIITLAEQYKKEIISTPYLNIINSQEQKINDLQSQIIILNQRIIDLEDQLLHKQLELDECQAEYTKVVEEKTALQIAYDELVRENTALQDIVNEYDMVKANWKFIHAALND